MNSHKRAALLGLSVAAYTLLVRPFLVNWGATRDEVQRPYPGVDLVPGGKRSGTMATTIGAPPSRVWPWLVQMGCNRAGWYSYDLLDNGGRHSATTIIPALQHLAIGDVMPAVPGARDAFVVVDFTPYKMLLL